MSDSVRGWVQSASKQLSVVANSDSHWVLYLLFSAILLNYVTTPLGFDQQINVAFAQQATLIGQFPRNVVEAWTVRGVGYKLFVYLHYVLADSVVNYYNKPLFELLYRVQIAIVYLIVIFISGLASRPRLKADGYDVISVLFLAASAFLTLSHWVAFQAEGVAALFTVLGVALSLSKHRGSTPLAGIVFALLITFKGITGLLIPVGYLLVLAYEGTYREYYPDLLIWTGASGVTISAALLAFAPRTVFDLVEATQFQSTFGTSMSTRLFSVLKFGQHFEHLPILLPAGVAGLLLILIEYRADRYCRLILLSLLGGLPILYVLVQGLGYGYHFAVLLPTAVGVFLWVGRYEREFGRVRWSSVLVCSFLLLATVSVSPLAIFGTSSPTEWQDATREQAELYSTVRNETNLSSSTTVLYLADGTTTYHLGAESYLRYYYPLPIQCVQWNERLRRSDIHRRVYERSLGYEGEYVIRTEWFDLAEFPRLQRKLMEEYCVVYRGSTSGISPENVTVYERGVDGCGKA